MSEVRVAVEMMSETTIVNIKTCPDFDICNPNDIYISRFHQSAKYGRLPKSKWSNPFKISDEFGRADTIKAYRKHLLYRPYLLLELSELKGKRLGCWCKPLACHGDVLIELLKEE